MPTHYKNNRPISFTIYVKHKVVILFHSLLWATGNNRRPIREDLSGQPSWSLPVDPPAGRPASCDLV